MKGKAFTIIGIVTCILIAFSSFIGVFGVPKNNIEQDARKSQKIDNTWEVSKSINDKLCAMIFYNDTLKQHIFSIYVNRTGFSFGYFFNCGGSDGVAMDGIHEFAYGANGSAIISMNKDRVKRIELNNGIESTKIDVDPSRPFAVVISENCGSVTLYNDNENVVPITIVESKE